jgi:hypothetical protein
MIEEVVELDLEEVQIRIILFIEFYFFFNKKKFFFILKKFFFL